MAALWHKRGYNGATTMTIERNKSKKKGDGRMIYARVDRLLNERLNAYRNRKDVRRPAGFVVRQAVEEFLTAREKEGAK